MAQDYKARPGDCISSIAFTHGFFWETLWNHSKNSVLKSKRQDPNILGEGDVVHIPDLRTKDESAGAESTHRFKVKGVPAKLKLRLMRPKPKETNPDEEEMSAGGGLGGLGAVSGLLVGDSGGDNNVSNLADPDYVPPKEEEEPIKNADYIFEVDGVEVAKGRTDGDGCVQLKIIPDARKGRLIVHPGLSEERIIPLELGGMDPIDEVSGIRKRLSNLGYFCQLEGPEDAEDVQTALRGFQEKNGLQATGKPDDATKDKLKSINGC
jgi:Putative peptidoglycan binding domain